MAQLGSIFGLSLSLMGDPMAFSGLQPDFPVDLHRSMPRTEKSKALTMLSMGLGLSAYKVSTPSPKIIPCSMMTVARSWKTSPEQRMPFGVPLLPDGP